MDNPSRHTERVVRGIAPSVEGLEARQLMAGPANLAPSDVETILQRAARASASDDAIIAVVDRNGTVLGVRAEAGVSPSIYANPQTLVFAVDGAIAKARTGAFFGNNQAPLTSRTIQDISQSTMTQREVQSTPDNTDPNSAQRGPGFVAPVGTKAHFPPRIRYTPQVDLFQIEHTNRDSIISPGPDRIRGTADDVLLPSRFNTDPQYIPPGKDIAAPESYGFITGLLDVPGLKVRRPDGTTSNVNANTAQSRGIATLPGGIPIFENGQVVGGIGVFFPGNTGFATEENSNLNDNGFYDPSKRDRSLEAEYIAFVAVGGSRTAGASFNSGVANFNLKLPPLPSGFDLPFGRIDLVGVTLDIFGGHGRQGPKNLVDFGSRLGLGNKFSGVYLPIVPGKPVIPGNTTSLATLQDGYLAKGKPVPQGWLVIPHDSPLGTLTAADVTAAIQRGIAESKRVRAAIRLPLDSQTRMILTVTDSAGNVLGLFREPDATFFSIDVAVAKARNVAYYADATQLQQIDKLPGIPAGTAFTNRTFRYIAQPRYPEGIDFNPPGPFSILNEIGITTGLNRPANSFTSVQAFDSFNPQTNFRQPFNLNQNGIVFFPGSAPVYKDLNGDGVRELVGGLGISGDGVDQDDDVTFQSATEFQPPSTVRRSDQTMFRGARLPYQKFNRQPHLPSSNNSSQQTLKITRILPKANRASKHFGR